MPWYLAEQFYQLSAVKAGQRLRSAVIIACRPTHPLFIHQRSSFSGRFFSTVEHCLRTSRRHRLFKKTFEDPSLQLFFFRISSSVWAVTLYFGHYNRSDFTFLLDFCSILHLHAVIAPYPPLHHRIISVISSTLTLVSLSVVIFTDVTGQCLPRPDYTSGTNITFIDIWQPQAGLNNDIYTRYSHTHTDKQ